MSFPSVRSGACLLLAATWCSPGHGGDGLYVWHPAVGMTDGRRQDGREDAAEQDRLLRFCASPEVGVRRLYFLSDPDVWSPVEVARLLSAAARMEIDVFALPPGSIQDDWVRRFRLRRRCDHGAVLDWVDSILEFNRSAEGARFSGIQLDVEPHSARAPRLLGRSRSVWQSGRGGLLRSPRNRRLAAEYLELLDRIRARLDAAAPGMRLVATLPGWLDRDEAGESYRLRFGDESKPWAFHIMDRLDFVTVMNYVDGSTPESLERAWREVAGEVTYGPTEVLFETAPPGSRGDPPRRDETIFEEGEARYRSLKRWLRGWYGDHPNFVGFAAHHYLRAYGSGSSGWPSHDASGPGASPGGTARR